MVKGVKPVKGFENNCFKIRIFIFLLQLNKASVSVPKVDEI
jgi:hypothetical protein